MIQNSPALVPLTLLAAAILIPVLALKKEKLAYSIAFIVSIFF